MAELSTVVKTIWSTNLEYLHFSLEHKSLTTFDPRKKSSQNEIKTRNRIDSCKNEYGPLPLPKTHTHTRKHGKKSLQTVRRDYVLNVLASTKLSGSYGYTR